VEKEEGGDDVVSRIGNYKSKRQKKKVQETTTKYASGMDLTGG